MRKMLNGWFEASCHTPTCFSTYHDIQGDACRWCKRTVAELIAAGAIWLIWPLPASPVKPTT